MFTKLITRTELSYIRFGNTKMNCVMGTKTTGTFSRNIKKLVYRDPPISFDHNLVMCRKNIPICVK